jgi:hypothetical protein
MQAEAHYGAIKSDEKIVPLVVREMLESPSQGGRALRERPGCAGKGDSSISRTHAIAPHASLPEL